MIALRLLCSELVADCLEQQRPIANKSRGSMIGYQDVGGIRIAREVVAGDHGLALCRW